MKMLSVDKLESGMEVARDVKNLNGAILLTAGTLLSAQHLRMLKMWGIDAIHIAGGEGDNERQAALADITPSQREAAEAHVRHRFKHLSPTTPGLTLLVELAVLRVSARLAAAPQQPTKFPAS